MLLWVPPSGSGPAGQQIRATGSWRHCLEPNMSLCCYCQTSPLRPDTCFSEAGYNALSASSLGGAAQISSLAHGISLMFVPTAGLINLL